MVEVEVKDEVRKVAYLILSYVAGEVPQSAVLRAIKNLAFISLSDARGFWALLADIEVGSPYRRRQAIETVSQIAGGVAEGGHATSSLMPLQA